MRGPLPPLIATLFVGCYSPHYQDCVISCAASHQCPAGFECDENVGLCHAPGGSCAQGDDADTDTLGADASVYPTGPFGPGVQIQVSPANLDMVDPTLTGDMLEMYFASSGDIWVTKRTTLTSTWTDPLIVTDLSGASAESTPGITNDGLTMFFSTDKPPTLGATDVWMSTRVSRSAPWGSPSPVANINSGAADSAANMAANGLVLVLGSQRITSGVIDLFMTKRNSLTDGWDVPTEITELNVNGHAAHGSLSPDRLTIYFNSSRSGSIDLFTAHRTSQTFMFNTPTPITEINTNNHNEADPWVSPDGHHLFYSSNVSGVNRVYEATR